MAIDLGWMSEPQPAVVVDTKREYLEIPLGRLEPGRHVIELQRKSDWAIAVGG